LALSRIWVLALGFTSLTEVIIRAGSALVANATDGTHVAAVTNDVTMDSWAINSEHGLDLRLDLLISQEGNALAQELILCEARSSNSDLNPEAMMMSKLDA